MKVIDNQTITQKWISNLVTFAEGSEQITLIDGCLFAEGESGDVGQGGHAGSVLSGFTGVQFFLRDL